MAMENGIMPVMDYGDNNQNWLWIIVLFALMGWNRNGYGCGEQPVTQVQMQNGFDTAEILGKLNGLENGLCDGFYAMNTGLLNGFSQTKEAIGQVRFDTQLQTQQIMKNDCDNTQKILDAISGNRIAEMQNRINQLELQSALCGVIRYPNATTYTAGYSPCFNQGCGCE